MLLMYHSLPTRCSKITPDIVKKVTFLQKDMMEHLVWELLVYNM